MKETLRDQLIDSKKDGGKFLQNKTLLYKKLSQYCPFRSREGFIEISVLKIDHKNNMAKVKFYSDLNNEHAGKIEWHDFDYYKKFEYVMNVYDIPQVPAYVTENLISCEKPI